MSMEGIRIVAKVFSDMQQARYKLMQLAEREPGRYLPGNRFQTGSLATPEGKQDVLLANLLDVGKDAMEPQFLQYTMNRFGDGEPLGPVDGGP